MSILLGLLAGAHTASWGMYKDAPHEGFSLRKYFRSIVAAAAIALVLQWWTGLELTDAANAALFFGIVYAVERIALELWKGFVREEDQSKYFIPMQFSVLGRPVRSRAIRWTVLALIVVFLGAAATGVVQLQRTYPGLPLWIVLLGIGSLGGWLSAFGGAWKDAPVEGFETLKFFRSPLIATCWSIVMASLTTNWLYLALAGIGYTVATIETYKTFFFPAKPRGKFAGKPILYPAILEARRPVVWLYAGIWTLVLGILILGLLGPHNGLF